MIRRVIAIPILVVGLWLGWRAIAAIQFVMASGSGLSDALLSPPTSLLQLLAAGGLAFGGLLAALGRPGGAVVAAIGAAIIALLAGLMAMAGADPGMWRDEAMVAALMTLASAALFFIRR